METILLHNSSPSRMLDGEVFRYIEMSIGNSLNDISDHYGYHYVTSYKHKTKSDKIPRKLILSDDFGYHYEIGSLIANPSVQPFILLESKYIRYKKHNRDKGSWICTAHSAIRRRYQTIRSSIAILAGRWSKSSIAMMESHDINIFLIPFDFITQRLAEHGIDFDWNEKERDKAHQAWQTYSQLEEEDKIAIGQSIVAAIEKKLIDLIMSILDDSFAREISKVMLELVSNLGEIKVYEFDSVESAIEFLSDEELESLFIAGNNLTLFDPPVQYAIDE